MKPLHISKQITTREGVSLTNYLNDISRIPMVTVEEEVYLTIRIRQGDLKALEKLVSANLRFVVSVAKQYQFRGLNLHDLINEGNLGLVKAAKRFDETRGFKFISYAVWWIRQGIIQAISEKSRMIRLPLNKINVLTKINKVTSHFEQRNNRPPTALELSELIDCSVAEIEFCLNHSSKSISMDEPLNIGDGNLNYHNIIYSENSFLPEKNLMADSLESEINKILKILPSRDAYVVKMYFGIGVDYSFTLDEIASKLKMSKERARQIKSSALLRLRRSSSSEELVEFLR